MIHLLPIPAYVFWWTKSNNLRLVRYLFASMDFIWSKSHNGLWFPLHFPFLWTWHLIVGPNSRRKWRFKSAMKKGDFKMAINDGETHSIHTMTAPLFIIYLSDEYALGNEDVSATQRAAHCSRCQNRRSHLKLALACNAVHFLGRQAQLKWTVHSCIVYMHAACSYIVCYLAARSESQRTERNPRIILITRNCIVCNRRNSRDHATSDIMGQVNGWMVRSEHTCKTGSRIC